MMKKSKPMAMLPLSIEYHSGIPVYRQIINAITSAVANGEISKGDPLPTIRNLAEDLKINPNTVAKAYRELELTGVVASAGRNGTVVTGHQKTLPRPSPAEKKIKLKEIYSRAVAEARAHGISERDVAEIFNRGESHG
jgi:GntR family transcriptional regulator